MTQHSSQQCETKWNYWHYPKVTLPYCTGCLIKIGKKYLACFASKYDFITICKTSNTLSHTSICYNINSYFSLSIFWSIGGPKRYALICLSVKLFGKMKTCKIMFWPLIYIYRECLKVPNMQCNKLTFFQIFLPKGILGHFF